MLLVRAGKTRCTVGGVPAMRDGVQGGLLGIALSPTFERDRLVYLSFTEAGDGGAGAAVARGSVALIWRQTT